MEDYLPQEEGYTRQEISGLLGVSIDDLDQRYMSKFPVRAERFKLRQRALHVFNEAIRVIRFRSLLSSPPPSGKDLLKSLGDLMNETQTSCRDVYDCSCPELDELCDLARSAGASGSRLTGAGWGGKLLDLYPVGRHLCSCGIVARAQQLAGGRGTGTEWWGTGSYSQRRNRGVTRLADIWSYLVLHVHTYDTRVHSLVWSTSCATRQSRLEQHVAHLTTNGSERLVRAGQHTSCSSKSAHDKLQFWTARLHAQPSPPASACASRSTSNATRAPTARRCAATKAPCRRRRCAR